MLNSTTKFIRALPFTIAMTSCLIVVGLIVGSHLELLGTALRRAYGSSLKTTAEGDLVRVVSSLFLTAGGWRFFASVVMLAGSVGWAEWKHGTWRTMIVFFGVHVATLVFIYFLCVLPLATLKFTFAESLVDVRDVGPSAGYYGCLGFALAGLKHWWKWPVGLSIYAVLIFRLMSSVSELNEAPHLVMGDVAHLVALPLGGCLAGAFSRRSRSVTLESP